MASLTSPTTAAPKPGRQPWFWPLLQSAGVIALSAALLWVVVGPRPVQSVASRLDVPTAPVSIAGAPRIGSEIAPVVLIEFSDFECTFCRRFARDVFPKIQEEYVKTGRVALVFKHLPLEIHPDARHAAAAAECARREDRFEPMHDELFRAGSLTQDDVSRIWLRLGLKRDVLDGCVRDAARMVTADMGLAATLGVDSTPAFFVGTRLSADHVRVRTAISGAQPFSQFASSLNAALKEER